MADLANQTVVSPRKEERPWKKRTKDFIKKFVKNKPAVIGFFIIFFLIFVAINVSVFGWISTPHEPDTITLSDRFQGPSSEYWFGTDHMGRDIFSRIVHGMIYTLGIGFASVFMGAIVGIPL